MYSPSSNHVRSRLPNPEFDPRVQTHLQPIPQNTGSEHPAGMSQFLKPERLDAEAGSPIAQRIWKHWYQTFKNFVDSIEDMTDINKLNLLINNVDSTVYNYISEINNFEEAIARLEGIFDKETNEVIARNKLTTCKQKSNQSLDEYLHILQTISDECNFVAVSAGQYRDEAIRDAFIGGISSSSTRQQLLQSGCTDLQQIVLKAQLLDSSRNTSENVCTAHSFLTDHLNALCAKNTKNAIKESMKVEAYHAIDSELTLPTTANYSSSFETSSFKKPHLHQAAENKASNESVTTSYLNEDSPDELNQSERIEISNHHKIARNLSEKPDFDSHVLVGQSINTKNQVSSPAPESGTANQLSEVKQALQDVKIDDNTVSGEALPLEDSKEFVDAKLEQLATNEDGKINGAMKIINKADSKHLESDTANQLSEVKQASQDVKIDDNNISSEAFSLHDSKEVMDAELDQSPINDDIKSFQPTMHHPPMHSMPPINAPPVQPLPQPRKRTRKAITIHDSSTIKDVTDDTMNAGKQPLSSSTSVHLRKLNQQPDELSDETHSVTDNAASSAISYPRENEKDKEEAAPPAKEEIAHETWFIDFVKPEKEIMPAWKPRARCKVIGMELTEEEETQEVLRQTRSILNKLTPQKFSKLMQKVQRLPINTEMRLRGVIDLIFETAINQPNYCEAYANICRTMSQFRLTTATSTQAQQGTTTVEFRKILLTQCQREFEKDRTNEETMAKLRKKLQEATIPEEKQIRKEELEYAENKERRRMLGNIRFIGELFKLRMLTESIMHNCIMPLLKGRDDESLESLCVLLTTIGKDLDHVKGKQRMDQYFQQIDKIIRERKTSPRVRFKLQDVVDLRKNQWVQKLHPRFQTPITIDQIHEEAMEGRKSRVQKVLEEA